MSTTANPSTSAIDPLAIDTTVVERLLRGFIAQEVRKVGYERAILGLSGGVDSAVTAALAVRALGRANVVAVLLPYRTSSPASEGDARTVCDQLGLVPEVVDITPQIDTYFDRHPDAGHDRRGNKMARERMTVLYDLSLARHALVLGTSNKTELLLGYGTVHGDIAHALNPLGDLYKTQVFSLAESLGLPRQVIDKPPSADLFEGQSDEADLGYTYAELDALLHGLVDERRTRVELRSLGFADSLIDDIGHRLRASQYKRRPPLIAKVSGRTIDREFRYPRDWGH